MWALVWPATPEELLAERAEMTFPNAERDLLMCFASSKRSPVASVFLTLKQSGRLKERVRLTMHLF